MKLSDIAKKYNLDFKGEADIDGINSLSDAKPNEIAFLAKNADSSLLKKSQAGAFIVNESKKDMVENAILIKNPHLGMALVTEIFKKPLFLKDGKKPKIGSNSDILENVSFGKNVVIGKNVTVFSGCYIGDNVHIGDDSIIYPNTTILRDVSIGKSVIIHANSVIGSDGFGYAQDDNMRHVKIHHLGSVIIEDKVELGSNVSIDRAVFGNTIIKEGAKIDNLVQIAHNCEVGEYAIIVSQSGLAGSSKLGKGSMVGGQSAIVDHVTVGEYTMLAGRTAVTKDLEGNKAYGGAPAMEYKKWAKLQAKLSLMVKPVKK